MPESFYFLATLRQLTSQIAGTAITVPNEAITE